MDDEPAFDCYGMRTTPLMDTRDGRYGKISDILRASLPFQRGSDRIIAAGNTAAFLLLFTLSYADLFSGRM